MLAEGFDINIRELVWVSLILGMVFSESLIGSDQNVISFTRDKYWRIRDKLVRKITLLISFPIVPQCIKVTHHKNIQQ